MKLYIFDGVEDLTSSYHSGGGCVVIADNLERAKALVPAGRQYSYIAGYRVSMDITREAPDYSDEHCPLPEPEVFDLGDQVSVERVWKFPNAGCC